MPSYRGYRFPSEVISHVVWLYHRFSLSFRDVEDLLASAASTSRTRRSANGAGRSGWSMRPPAPIICGNSSGGQGEGHRKVHARLRILDGIRVARTRVLRVMRAHGLLSPHRGRQGDPQLHDGTIITAAPHVMWGTDGVRVFTVDDGWVWTFAAVDH